MDVALEHRHCLLVGRTQATDRHRESARLVGPLGEGLGEPDREALERGLDAKLASLGTGDEARVPLGGPRHAPHEGVGDEGTENRGTHAPVELREHRAVGLGRKSQRGRLAEHRTGEFRRAHALLGEGERATNGGEPEAAADARRGAGERVLAGHAECFLAPQRPGELEGQPRRSLDRNHARERARALGRAATRAGTACCPRPSCRHRRRSRAATDRRQGRRRRRGRFAPGSRR